MKKTTKIILCALFMQVYGVQAVGDKDKVTSQDNVQASPVGEKEEKRPPLENQNSSEEEVIDTKGNRSSDAEIIAKEIMDEIIAMAEHQVEQILPIVQNKQEEQDSIGNLQSVHDDLKKQGRTLRQEKTILYNEILNIKKEIFQKKSAEGMDGMFESKHINLLKKRIEKFARTFDRHEHEGKEIPKEARERRKGCDQCTELIVNYEKIQSQEKELIKDLRIIRTNLKALKNTLEQEEQERLFPRSKRVKDTPLE
jgi:hypothetical protein